MNLKSLIEYNRFKEAVTQRECENAKSEISDFAGMKKAENMDVAELFEAGKRLILIGVFDEKFSNRPIVYNNHTGSEYPTHDYLAFFKMMDFRQNLIELQDIIDVVPDPAFDLNMITRPCDEMTLVSIEQVYGKAVNKGNQLVANLTLAEVLSQLAPRYSEDDTFFFYVCDAAECCDNLTHFGGYHAYRIAVFAPERVPNDVIPDLTADGLTAGEII